MVVAEIVSFVVVVFFFPHCIAAWYTKVLDFVRIQKNIADLTIFFNFKFTKPPAWWNYFTILAGCIHVEERKKLH